VRADAGSPDFDEFSLLRDYAEYEGLPWKGQPRVERRFVEVAPGQRVSAVVWGDGEPELVFLHGGGQNVHTWDSVAMALDRPLIAVDLPGHGHSDWRDDREYWPWTNADAVAAVMAELAPAPKAVVGMSLGGLTTIRLAAAHTDLVPKVVIVDVSPGVSARTSEMTLEQRGPTALIGGPRTYPSFAELVEATARASGRDPEAVWRGARLNATQLDDGTWGWRYDQLRNEGATPIDFTPLWTDVASAPQPFMLVRGGVSAHVHDDDVEQYRRHKPDIRVEVVDGAGHSVQSAKPLVLAQLIEDFVFS